ncbi:PIN2/TERF1-interacting telomerase inhibitor 1 [Astyanax mexicanus]|uniref:PIN2/TERF1-interacting telomerase inhibitor 1 n=1 Tax=Astyanax mexicanus TaxID=7994 RepID=A0A8T2MI45_ASTMX|nr:PIN2/TERF1-interacting telomerase inhibitor 1 [Astyanax mexicanus]
MLQDPTMSMLAEPRRRQKWSVDPRNSAWSKDESKFGQKMLERMGWSKGKGLGKTGQGATDHIKVKVKNNSLGLGAAVYNEDNWIAHQDDFNQLLADLNNCHGQNSTEEVTQEQKQGFSLEEKSKTSRKRVHYMKFTKGKDLSNRSETDLACIFGKRSKKTRDQDEESSGPESQEEKEQNSEDDKEQPSNSELELNTVTSTLTMQEYFAQRMAQLKKGLSASSSPAASSSNTQSPSAPSTSIEDSPNTSDVEQSRKKKKKKRKHDRQEDEEKVEEAEEPQLKEEVVDTEQDPSERKKKKKKRKREAKEEDTTEECTVSTAIDDSAGDVADQAVNKKKKKKQKNKEDPSQTHTESVNEHDSTENVMDIEISDKKKKRRQRENLEQLEEQPEVIVEGKKSKKAKKKRKTDN